jgi:hypothetical protein
MNSDWQENDLANGWHFIWAPLKQFANSLQKPFKQLIMKE